MGKDMIIAILQSQLEASNETVKRLNATIESMEASFNATISELKATISNLENLLKERDESLGKAASQMRGMKATFLPKKSERQNLPTKPQTPEEKVAAEEERKARIKAANYFLNEWDGIEAISHYGDVDWDNNRLERINRYISLSRHNSLFFGSHEGAKRGCIFYSLACSCRCNGINFFDYLSDVLNKAADLQHLTPEAYRNLLPDRWTKE